MQEVSVYDPTITDKQSSVRGVGRYLQILKENFPEWQFIGKPANSLTRNHETVFINPFFNFLQPPLTIKRVADKQVAVIHDLITLKYPSHFPAGIKGRLNIYLNKLALRNYDTIITDSEASKKDIINLLRLPDDKIRVVYPCLPKYFLKLKIENLNLNKNSKFKIENSFCLYVGDATWNKNLVNLARAIKIINVSCVFVGKVFNPLTRKHINELTSYNKWQEEYIEFIKETEGDKRFIFAGFVTDSDLINLYQQSKLNILPSRDEGFGFSYLESARLSCPSVLSDIPVLQEISGGNALFFDPKNPSDIADKIGEIYFNRDIGKKLGAKSKKRSEFFTPDKFKKSFLNAISD